MEVVGFALVCFISLACSALPIVMAFLSGPNKGLDTVGKITCLLIWCFAGFGWWFAYMNSPFTSTVS